MVNKENKMTKKTSYSTKMNNLMKEHGVKRVKTDVGYEYIYHKGEINIKVIAERDLYGRQFSIISEDCQDFNYPARTAGWWVVFELIKLGIAER